jgi:hypothetical protein
VSYFALVYGGHNMATDRNAEIAPGPGCKMES